MEPDHCMALVRQLTSSYLHKIGLSTLHAMKNNYGAYLVESAKSFSNSESREESLESAYRIFERANSLQPGLPAFNLACISALKGDKTKARNWLLEAYLQGTVQGEHGSFLLEEEQDLSSLRSEAWFKELVALTAESHLIEQPDYKLFFAGQQVNIYQAQLRGNEDAKGIIGTTGWTVWNSCFVILRYLEKLLEKDQLRLGTVLDLSGGLGLLGIACALRGGECIVSEVGPAQLEAINKNARYNLVENKVRALEFPWGAQSTVSKLGNLDLVLASDLLYIAIRDNLEEELLSTLLTLVNAPGSPTVVFAFEVRLPHREDAFMKQLEKCIVVKLHPRHDVDVSDINVKNEGSQQEENLESMFYEQPDVRLYSLKASPVHS